MRHIQPDFVFACALGELTYRLLASDLAKSLLVWEFTNANPDNKFSDREAIRLLQRAKAVLSPSAAIDRNIRSTYGFSGPVLRLPFWIEEVPLERQLEPEEFLTDFIFLGRRDAEKGLAELVQAAALLRDAFPRLSVLITGSGSKEPFLTLARQLGVADRISFRFFPERGQALDALSRSRFLVLPSYHEGYPLVLLEAARCGVPVVATTVGSIPEMLGGSPSGWLVPPQDPHSLAKAMRVALAETPLQYKRRRQAAFELYHRLNSPGAVSARLHTLLREAQALKTTEDHSP